MPSVPLEKGWNLFKKKETLPVKTEFIDKRRAQCVHARGKRPESGPAVVQLLGQLDLCEVLSRVPVV